MWDIADSATQMWKERNSRGIRQAESLQADRLKNMQLKKDCIFGDFQIDANSTAAPASWAVDLTYEATSVCVMWRPTLVDFHGLS